MDDETGDDERCVADKGAEEPQKTGPDLTLIYLTGTGDKEAQQGGDPGSPWGLGWGGVGWWPRRWGWFGPGRHIGAAGRAHPDSGLGNPTSGAFNSFKICHGQSFSFVRGATKSTKIRSGLTEVGGIGYFAHKQRGGSVRT